jgi:hypothetical protein
MGHFILMLLLIMFIVVIAVLTLIGFVISFANEARKETFKPQEKNPADPWDLY